MNRRARFALVGLLSTVVVAGACRKSEPPPIAMQAGNAETVTFPPPAAGWTDRAPLPPEASNAVLRDDLHTRLVSPTLDARGGFTFEGQDLALYFSGDLFSDPKQAPAVTITPKVAGKVSWYGGSHVEFHANEPFDPNVEYTLEVAGTTGVSGKNFEPLKATFKATPAIWVAGKTIHYVPAKGHPRVVAMYPGDISFLGGAQEVTAVYDQPIDLTEARALVKVEGEGDAPLASTLRHPSGTMFEGQKVDPRWLVVVKPTTKLAPGKKVTVTARSKDDANEAHKATYTIAAPTTVSKIGEQAASCTQIPVISHAAGRSLNVQLSNPLRDDWDAANKAVHITPRPQSLYAGAYSGLNLSGSFKPSTTYSVSVDALRDAYGGKACPFAFTLRTKALPASATIPDGAVILDESEVRAFQVTTRNVTRGSLLLWALPKDDAAAFADALRGTREEPSESNASVTVPFTPRPALDEVVTTTIDLDRSLERGRAYVARVKIEETVPDAEDGTETHPTHAGRPPTSILLAGGPSALGAHIHRTGSQAVVQVFRLAGGEPVGKAKVTVGKASAVTNELGTAKLDVPEGSVDAYTAVSVVAPDASLLVPMNQTGARAASALFPEYATQGSATSPDRAGMIVTDRGVYRPGSVVHAKAFARKAGASGSVPIAKAKMHLRLVDPTDAVVFDKAVTTSDLGTIAEDIPLDATWTTGRFHLRLEADDAQGALADEMFRVAVFETPKFKVDVTAVPGTDRIDAPTVEARISARYLFGAPMNGAQVAWSIRKSALPIEPGDFAAAGLSFGKSSQAWWDREETPSPAPVVGEGRVADDGTFTLNADPGQLADGPTELTVEADVSDASQRHVSGTFRTKRDPVPLHVGMKLARRFGQTGQPVRAEFGVIDREGHALPGKVITARIERLEWKRSSTKTPSGATVERWTDVKSLVGQCSVTSAKAVAGCELPIPRNGSYVVTAQVDGRDDTTLSYWAYGGAYDPTDRAPSSGNTVPVVLDKENYAAGDTAHVLVQSPYANALAVLTVEQGGLLSHTSQRVQGTSATFDVPIQSSNVPWIYAVVTLLPIGETQADYRIAAARIPVDGDSARLRVTTSSAKKSYEVGDEASVTITVKDRAGAPVKGADVTLAVVDEGILRMTNFHAKDAATELHPGRALSFWAGDTRTALFARREHGHVAGGGDGSASETLDARKNFVETAAWLPALRSDEHGNVTAKFKLPDNLTEFRAMAVVVDGKGRGGASESSFVVTKALLLDPAMPAFALRGDNFEAAAMAHNNTSAPIRATVTIAGQDRDVTIPANGHERVAVPMTADKAGTRTVAFALRTGATVRDKVELPLRIDEPGVEEHPWLSGSFTARQEVHVEIPADALYEEGAFLSLKTGSALYPGLGRRIGFLLDYPHGCAEQTTSSLLPLLAARTIMPWAGVEAMNDQELRKRIQAGVDRLATMRTQSGGLAYWPGGYEPNVFATTYALRALVQARAMGIEKPRLIDGIATYLTELLPNEESPSLKVAVGEALSILGKLPPESADSMYDTREKLDLFGKASLALALSTLPNQNDRVRELLDRLEGSFDERGEEKTSTATNSYEDWGSADRDRAQTLIALTKLRATSGLVPALAQRLSQGIERWSTQSTAWSLLALSEFMGARSPNGSVDVRVKSEGRILDSSRKLGGDNKEVRIPLRDLAGRKVTLLLEGDSKVSSAFALHASYKRPFGASPSRVARRAAHGVSIHRAYSDAQGKRIDLGKVKAGDIVRVALRVELPKLPESRLGYLAVTDRLPAGLATMNPDLATTTGVALATEHPYYQGFSRYGASASHIDLRDDRVHIYFDQIWGGPVVYATYLTRATTPGAFVIPPAFGELMYEPDSEGYSDTGQLTVR